MKKVLLIKYGEIALRGRNRGLFEKKLIHAILNSVKDVGDNFYVHKEQGRLILEDLSKDIEYDRVTHRVANVFGIVGVCPCYVIEDQSIENIEKMAVVYVKENYKNLDFTYKVFTRRSDKRYPIESNDVSIRIGGFILDNIPTLSVNVHDPEEEIHVELRNKAYIFSKEIKGFGGLPKGSTGNGTLLLSGGIDSPVAGFLMAKRGIELHCVYFHSPPYTSNRAKEKVIDLAKELSKYTGGIKLYIVPFTETQLFIYENTPPEKMTILLKRIMLRISEKIGKKNKSLCLVVGDSVGQVASQTLHSINAINSASQLPIIRPLAGYDKQEIIDLALKINTYPISIRPFEDCCTIFVAKHPETKSKRSIIENIEATMFQRGLEEHMTKAVDQCEILEL
ncbi:MAG: tRNA uracil 4-sulfurtransferase ThiI [Lachnospirales bacterium]